jgi:hypothetical protein
MTTLAINFSVIPCELMEHFNKNNTYYTSGFYSFGVAKVTDDKGNDFALCLDKYSKFININ